MKFLQTYDRANVWDIPIKFFPYNNFIHKLFHWKIVILKNSVKNSHQKDVLILQYPKER
jgi:hypothetical protein